MVRLPSRRTGGWPGALVLAIAFQAAAIPASAEAGYSPLAWHDAPRPLPELLFETRAGQFVRLRDFRGKVVLLNVWATWCGTCRKEMPHLDRLQGMLGERAFAVVALSIDRNGRRAVEPFYEDLGLRYLRIYLDRTRSAMRRLRVYGIPESILIDRQGREIARHHGPNGWTAPPLVRSIRRVIRGTAPSRRKRDAP